MLWVRSAEVKYNGLYETIGGIFVVGDSYRSAVMPNTMLV